MTTPPKPYTVAIIGGGVAGPVLALTILSNPSLSALYKPIIYEKLPEPQESDATSAATYAAGAAVALTSNALYPLIRLGLKERLDQISCETTKIDIWRAWIGGVHKHYNFVTNPGWKKDLGTNLRVVERRDLQGLLLEKIKELGGEVIWDSKLKNIEETTEKRLQIIFESGSEVVADLLVGADGSWSSVRRYISEQIPAKDEKVARQERWKPEFAYSEGIYGVSKKIEGAETQPGDTHWILLDAGTASTWALPNGKQFWTISLPSSAPPERESSVGENAEREYARYHALVNTGGYTSKSTEAILKAHEDVWHPVAGTFGEVFKNSERIVRAALWHRAWEPDEIGNKNIAVIGDAARTMVPTSGQGACFAIEDATILANMLLNHSPSKNKDGSLSFESAIEEYARSRVPRNKRMANQSYWTGVVSLGARWWWRWLRDFGSAWLPMSGDPKDPAKKGAKDPMGWLYDERYKVEVSSDAVGTEDSTSLSS
ncbi:hypothetical protein B0O99DRAFT_58969 [Bisporella sp. PMI_857]|nr:hypothetical protein B0O99DRAFT_58969 [Bisporella sp. PMI_857]